MFMLLIAAAAIGIGYGLSCVIELVQAWAGFNSFVEHVIH